MNLHKVKHHNSFRYLLGHTDKHVAKFASIVQLQTFKILNAAVEGGWWCTKGYYTLKIEILNTGHIHTLKIPKSIFDDHVVEVEDVLPSENIDYRVENVGSHASMHLRQFTHGERFTIKACRVYKPTGIPCYSFVAINKYLDRKTFTISIEEFSKSIRPLIRIPTGCLEANKQVMEEAGKLLKQTMDDLVYHPNPVIVNTDGTLTVTIKTDEDRKRVIKQLENMVLNWK